MNHDYDSGGHKKDQGKYADSYKNIFKDVWPCEECNNTRAQGHKMDCSKHWRNKND